MIVQLRDSEQLSWDKISDRVDLHLAKKHNRRPTLRCNRARWCKSTCRRVYLAEKERQANNDEPTEPTHRRCQRCNRSLPVSEFAKVRGKYRRRVCLLCQSLPKFRAADQATHDQFVRGLKELARLARGDHLGSHQAQQVYAELLGLFDGHGETALSAWKDALDTAQQRGQTRFVLNQLLLVGHGLILAEKGRAADQARWRKGYAEMSDDELQAEVDRLIVRVAEEGLIDGSTDGGQL
jgi:hypothetical protein